MHATYLVVCLQLVRGCVSRGHQVVCQYGSSGKCRVLTVTSQGLLNDANFAAKTMTLRLKNATNAVICTNDRMKTSVYECLLKGHLLRRYQESHFCSSTTTILSLHRRVELVMMSSVSREARYVSLLCRNRYVTLSRDETYGLHFSRNVTNVSRATSLVKGVSANSYSRVRGTLYLGGVVFSRLYYSLRRAVITKVNGSVKGDFYPIDVQPCHAFSGDDHAFHSGELSTIASGVVTLKGHSRFGYKTRGSKLCGQSELMNVYRARVAPRSIRHFRNFLVIRNDSLALKVRV